MLEIDRWALARAAEFQADTLAHFEAYEFHPVVAKLQLFCSEDLGGFYLDVLKDRLYTTAPKSLARRSAQTALWQLTHAMRIGTSAPAAGAVRVRPTSASLPAVNR